MHTRNTHRACSQLRYAMVEPYIYIYTHTHIYIHTHTHADVAYIHATLTGPAPNFGMWRGDSLERNVQHIIDTQNIPDHIHDTAIDGTGQIISIFWDGDWYNSPTLQTLDGGLPGSVSWDFVFDGGVV